MSEGATDRWRRWRDSVLDGFMGEAAAEELEALISAASELEPAQLRRLLEIVRAALDEEADQPE
jgi:hypothetical protein